LILIAFEESNWAFRIDNPLPANSNIDPVEQMANAVRRLNGHQITPLIHFGIDGTSYDYRFGVGHLFDARSFRLAVI
jgi:hypothetical protein